MCWMISCLSLFIFFLLFTFTFNLSASSYLLSAIPYQLSTLSKPHTPGCHTSSLTTQQTPNKISQFFGLFGKLMKLTRRQEIFIHRLLDLYWELNRPIHYSLLAERVGVSPFTAYDMLRLLEEKGYVTSEYRIGSEKPSVGRSKVVFEPTKLARRRIEELATGADLGDWDSTRARILARVRTGEFQNRILAEEMLARVPPKAPETLRYCFEVMMVLMLRLGRGTGRHILAERLPQFLELKGAISRSGLLLLGGFVLGLLADENAIDLDRDQSIIKQVERYQALVMEMEPNLCRRLGDGIKDMFVLVFQS